MSANKKPSPLFYLSGIAVVTFIGWLTITLWSDKPADRPSTLSSFTQSSSTDSPEGGYDFYSLLASAEVVVRISNYTSTLKTAKLDKPTLLQIAAFRDINQATQIQARLQSVGLKSVQVVERQTSTGIWYLVRTPPISTYAELKEAIKLSEKLNFHPSTLQVK